MMDKAIKDFAKQFRYRPKIVGGKVKKYKKYIVAGMGGSHLAGDIIKSLAPELDIVISSDYAPQELNFKKTLIIASSYSGNTEETIDWFEKAVQTSLPVVAIATGGKLLELSKKHSIPYIQLPDTGIQPRSALGFSFLAMLKVMRLNDLLKEAKGLAKSLDPKALEEAGKNLAGKLKNHVPVIYASAKNYAVAYNWKIKFNETGKIPAFYNVLPELNHNEMTGFSAAGGATSGGDAPMRLSQKFYFIFIKNSDDHPKILKRFEVLEKLYHDRGLSVEVLELQGASYLEKIFNSLLLADWTALYTAQNYGLEPEQVPMVEEFKRLILP